MKYEENKTRHQAKMETRNSQQMSDACVVELFSEVTTQSITFTEQKSSIETSKIRR